MPLRRSTLVPIALALLSGCSTTEAPHGPLPVLPNADGIVPDLSMFHDLPAPSSGSVVNWTTALDRVTFAETAYVAKVAVPVAFLNDATLRTPTPQGELWKWPVSTVADGQSFTGSVIGAVLGANNAWNVVVSAPGLQPPLTDFRWLSGIADPTGGTGTWHVADVEHRSTTDIATIDWMRNSLATNFTAGIITPSSTLSYQEQNGALQLDYVTGDVAPRFRLRWNPTLGTGGVSVADGDFMCWDAQQHDTSCP